MRRALDLLYDGAAWLAALFMVLIFLVILLQVASASFDFYVRGTDAYAGYFMAGASFMALAHTLKKGEHIRVTLILQQLKGRARRVAELWCLGAAGLLSGAFSFYAWKMVVWSYRFHDVSSLEDRLPTWIPELVMSVGVTILFVAFLDEFVQVLGGRSVAEAEDMVRSE